MARTGSSTVSTTETLVFESDRHKGGQVADGPPARMIQVSCSSSSAVSLLARVPSLHGSTSTVTIAAGDTRVFSDINGDSRTPALHALYLTGSGGTATYTFECVG